MGQSDQKAAMTFRISIHTSKSDSRFAELLRLFRENPGATDEITLFTQETHPPLPLETVREHAAVLKKRIAEAKAAGFRAGINILATMGHHNENLPGSLQGDYTRVTDMEGRVSHGSFCPNDERFAEYVTEIYRLYTAAEPDYIWVDDDVRLMGHGPVGETCFCERCIALFNEENGTSYTRESLRRALGSGDTGERLRIRKDLLSHNRKTIARLLSLVERTAHAIRPGLPLGFMTGERYFEGYDFAAWADALSGPEQAEVLWRPGGGFYTDANLAEMTEKAHEVGRQCSLLPSYVTRIQSEIENFPYQLLRKSPKITALEAAAHIAAGCTGAAMNVLSDYGELYEDYTPMVKKIASMRPFYDLVVGQVGRAPTGGIYTGWNTDSYAAHDLEGDWRGGGFGQDTTWFANELFDIGLPPAYGREDACVTVLCGDSVCAMDDRTIREILSGGVYLNASALDRLNAMGYGELTGFGVGERFSADAVEQMTGHRLNGRYADVKRDARQSFYREPSAALHPAPGAEVLARMVDYRNLVTADCCMGVYENSLGGRVCAAGYFPFTFLKCVSKAAQIKNVMAWLSRGRMPACVASFHKVSLWARLLPEGGLGLVLANMYHDAAEDVRVDTVSSAAEASLCREDTGKTVLPVSGGSFVIPGIAPFEICYVRL